MSIGRLSAWAFTAFLALVPLNWIRIWIAGENPKDSTITQFLIGTLICWGIAAALAYFLIVSARGIKLRKQREEKALQTLLEAPLTAIQPRKALVKAGETAYAAVAAELQEVQTVGYSAGTSGVSVRVAKGVTLRTAGTRGKAVKGMVSVASGELVISDKRIIFAGDRKSFAISLEDILSTTNYTDGFGFSDNKTTYTLTTTDEPARLRFSVALEKILRGT
jgi:hypothetical protein